MKIMGTIFIYLISFIVIVVFLGWFFIYLYNSSSYTLFKAVEIDSESEWMLVCRNRYKRNDHGVLEHTWMQEDPKIINLLKEKIKIKNNINDFLYQNEASAEKFLGNSIYLYKNNQLVASKHYPGYNFDFKSIENTLIPVQYKRFITEDYKALLAQEEQLKQKANVRFITIPTKEMYEFKTRFYFPFGKRMKEKGNIKEEMAQKLQNEYGIKPEQLNFNGGSSIANQENSDIIDFIGFRLSFASQEDIDKMTVTLKETPYYLGKNIWKHSYLLEYLTLIE